jgi:hypothetical protein
VPLAAIGLRLGLVVDLAWLGATRLEQLNRSSVHAAPVGFQPHVHSAFPLMDISPPHHE